MTVNKFQDTAKVIAREKKFKLAYWLRNFTTNLRPVKSKLTLPLRTCVKVL